MFRKISTKLKSKSTGGKVQQSPSKVSNTTQGAAVPYTEPSNEAVQENASSAGGTIKSQTDSIGGASSLLTTSSSEYNSDGHILCEAAAKGDTEAVRQILSSGYDINSKDDKGNTALIRAAASGQAKILRFLLLHGADVEIRNERNKNSLYVAVEQGHVQTVGVLLDYMHSVDRRPRAPFVYLRGRRIKGGEDLVENVANCKKIIGFKKQGVDLVELLVAQGQKSEDMAVFLYSILDVSVRHSFIVNVQGDMNINNFQRFENHGKTESITALNSNLKIFNVQNYTQLKTLILVSCSLHKLNIDKLPSLELLDVRHNKLQELPPTLCKCSNLKNIKVAYNHLKQLPNLGFLHKTLEWLDCSYNFLKYLPNNLVNCIHLKHLYTDHNLLVELLDDIGVMSQLEQLTVDNNKLAQLPLSIASLTKLKKITFNNNPLQNIPVDFPERGSEVREYLSSLQNDPVPNRTVKLVLVGQEGVGKTTLLKAIKRTFWAIPHSPSTPKTDGIDIKDIILDELTLRCFDCGGDVDFNETHNFFITQGALYLACFNLSEYCISTVERSSFLLGRLQLWLQYIFSKVPSSQVIIVGTHADHQTMTRDVFDEIWEQLRNMMVNARLHHRSYFKGDKHPDCLICQSDTRCLKRTSNSGSAGFVNLGFDSVPSKEDETSFSDDPNNIITFPHIMGYYEVSSVKAIGNSGAFHFITNQSIEHLKTAISAISTKIINTNPEIPRKWANVRESLQRYSKNQENSVVTLSEISHLSSAHGVSSKTELTHMLHFLKAQGSLLYFPQIEELENIVILDPEWLAKIFSAVVSYRDTGISNEGFIEREKLKLAWGSIQEKMQEKLLSMLHHFGLCLPISGTNLEIFPCKLPIGEPDFDVWPSIPPHGIRQLTYCITFPAIIPPPMFSDLIVAVFRYRADVNSDKARYFANNIADVFKLDRIGCKDCKIKPEPVKDEDPSVLHQILYELVPHNRTIYMTVRGTLPCCTMRKAGRVLNKVVSRYEGLCTVDLDSLVCPGCYMQKHQNPDKFSPKSLQADKKRAGEKIVCANGHALSDAKSLLTGIIHNSCMPNATIKSKVSSDYSGCPKLFIALPVNKDGTSFDKDLKLFVSSVLFDGYAAHLLCEFPDGYHLCSAPGYRLKNPKDFMSKFGAHIVTILHLLVRMAGSSVSGVRYGNLTMAVANKIDFLIQDFNTKFPMVKNATSMLKASQLITTIQEKGKKFKRDDLKKHFHIADKPDSFGHLRRLYYADSYIWLCNDHYKQLRVLSIGTLGTQSKKESSA